MTDGHGFQGDGIENRRDRRKMVTGAERKEGPRAHEECCVSRGHLMAGKGWLTNSFLISRSAGDHWELLTDVIDSCIWQWGGSKGKEKVTSFGRWR